MIRFINQAHIEYLIKPFFNSALLKNKLEIFAF